MDNLILVDTSYTSFYRFFATLRWLTMSKPEIYNEHIKNPKYNWLNDEIFLDKYEKMYLESIIKLVGKRVFNKSKIIFCMDTPKEQVWRTTQIKCDYKGDRIDLSEKNDFKPVFAHTYDNLIPKLINKYNNIKKLRLEHLEADDIIACICKYFEKKDPNLPIYIVSGDEDFLQLGRNNIKISNYKLKKPYEITKDDSIYKLHKKILLGDKSDCIPTIFPKRFNTKLKKELLESIEKFNIWIKTEPEIKKIYEHNKNLIDFDNIPKNYQKQVINEYEKLFNI
jgi:5'-3' exonuclease